MINPIKGVVQGNSNLCKFGTEGQFGKLSLLIFSRIARVNVGDGALGGADQVRIIR
jgi:hypothetical protein